MNMVTDYEVYGCWTYEDVKGVCPKCSSTLELVPEEGHYNSKYWRLKRDDGLDLYCCPKGCNNDFLGAIRDNAKELDEKTLKSFCFVHDVDYEKGDMNILHDYYSSVHVLPVREFVYNYEGFVSYHLEDFGGKSDVEFLIDVKSGYVFFNIPSHEPFASWLYELVFPNVADQDRLYEAERNGFCIWKSTISNTIHGLDNPSIPTHIRNKFK